MTCTIDISSETIGGFELERGEVVFVCACDDNRFVMISGQFCERFSLPEILTRIAQELTNTTIEIERL